MSRLREINNLAAEIISGSYFQGGHRIANKNAKKIFSLSEPVELNENQQITLDWLKGQYKHLDLLGVFSNFSNLTHLTRIFNNEEDFRIYNAFCQLTSKQQFEVLQAFAEWGLNHDRN